jgi:hypothetical protein
MFSNSLTKRFKGFGSGFTEIYAKFDAHMLLDFATKSEKHSCKNNVYSQRVVTWQTGVIGLRKCGLCLPVAVTTLTVRKLSDSISYYCTIATNFKSYFNRLLEHKNLNTKRVCRETCKYKNYIIIWHHCNSLSEVKGIYFHFVCKLILRKLPFTRDIHAFHLSP